MNFQFGSGVLYGVPSIALDGSAVTAPTPVMFGALQDVSMDFNFTKKELYGMYQFPLAVARGAGKIDCKAKMAQFNAALFNLVFGETTAAGEIKTAFNESVTVTTAGAGVPAQSQYTILDLGAYKSDGTPMTRTAAASTAGSLSTMGSLYYYYSTGSYVFGSTLYGNSTVLINYAYTATAAGVNFTINNQLLGLSPFFKARLRGAYQGNQMNVTLNLCTGTKFTLATKQEDFWIPEFDFSAMADSSNVVGTVSVG